MSKPFRPILFILAFAIGAIAITLWLQQSRTSYAQTPAQVQAEQAPRSYAGSNPAPAFPANIEWVNSQPLDWPALKGKVVLLDFLTYGCINCIHIIPDLKKLEAKYPNELVVIGVHSAKYEREKNTQGIQQFIERYDIHHPMVNDKDFTVWRSYGARAWPTLVLIDPAGKVVGKLEGEGHYEALDRVIGSLANEFKSQLNLDNVVQLSSMPSKDASGPLHYPGKITRNEEWLVASDTGHHQLVAQHQRTGQILRIGSGEPGLGNGNFQQAQFQNPQGIALDGHLLYVADTENHALRQVNLKTQVVSTLVGDGTQHYMRILPAEKKRKSPAASLRTVGRLEVDLPPLVHGLNSPWDVMVHNQQLYVAMAGQHQIWRWDIGKQTLHHFAGSGREELKDGSLKKAGLNQPSALANDGTYLYAADTEANAIRRMPLLGAKVKKARRGIHTLVGTGLFDFGDRDGRFAQALLQHPVGLSYADGKLYVADTYNHKLKTLDLKTEQVSTLFGTAFELSEPSGVHVWGDSVYIADTNHHRIVRWPFAAAETQATVIAWTPHHETESK